jgi:rhodanese-related sulfurtransferase
MSVTTRTVGAREAHELMAAGYAYVDVRSAPEFAEGRPSGAINVEWKVLGAHGFEPNPRFVEQIAAHFSTDTPLIIGCKAGDRSIRAAEALLGAGFREVVVARAGFDGVRDHFGRVVEPGWSRLGLPTDCG